jgi:hypothetical protein
MPGASLVVEPGTRNTSISIRIRGGSEPIRLSQTLAGEISVVADLPSV